MFKSVHLTKLGAIPLKAVSMLDRYVTVRRNGVKTEPVVCTVILQ